MLPKGGICVPLKEEPSSMPAVRANDEMLSKKMEAGSEPPARQKPWSFGIELAKFAEAGRSSAL